MDGVKIMTCLHDCHGDGDDYKDNDNKNDDNNKNDNNNDVNNNNDDHNSNDNNNQTKRNSRKNYLFIKLKCCQKLLQYWGLFGINYTISTP